MAKCPTCSAPVNLAPDGDPRYDVQLDMSVRAEHVTNAKRIAELEAEVERLQAAIKEHYEVIFSSPYGHETSANKLLATLQAEPETEKRADIKDWMDGPG